jgi:uncharacterized protein
MIKLRLYFTIIFSFGISSYCFAQAEKELSQKFVNYIFVEKDYKGAQLLFDESLHTQVTEILLQNTSTTLQNQLGNYINIIEINQEKIDSTNIVYAYTKFKNANLDIKLVFNTVQKMMGFFIVPHKEFEQNDIKNSLIIPNSNYPIYGELGLPVSENKKVLAIFIHGSGPQDKDGSIFENKPYKDIASGFSKRGITSYRFDKKSFSYPEYFKDDNYTIDDEVCNDVYTIVDYFKNDSIYKTYKIILVGHSMGGMLLPRMADSLKNSINGIVMLSANSMSFCDVINYQLKYLYAIQPSIELKKQMTELKTKLEYLNSKAFNLQSDKNLLPLNLPASYWNSILNYNQIKMASRLVMPALIIQGGRDYQVNTKNFKLWKKSLKNKGNVTFKIYPLLNHILLEGNSKSTPSEYQIKSKVPDYFINDISNWILESSI